MFVTGTRINGNAENAGQCQHKRWIDPYSAILEVDKAVCGKLSVQLTKESAEIWLIAVESYQRFNIQPVRAYVDGVFITVVDNPQRSDFLPFGQSAYVAY